MIIDSESIVEYGRVTTAANTTNILGLVPGQEVINSDNTSINSLQLLGKRNLSPNSKNNPSMFISYRLLHSFFTHSSITHIITYFQLIFQSLLSDIQSLLIHFNNFQILSFIKSFTIHSQSFLTRIHSIQLNYISNSILSNSHSNTSINSHSVTSNALSITFNSNPTISISF